jgi:ribonuclease HII
VQQYSGHICGLDEAGRGPLAGPVVAACVVLSADFPVHLLDDSKKLSEQKRMMLEALIKENALSYGIGLASHKEIDRINILNASMLAMQRAYDKVNGTIEIALALVDGNKVPLLSCSTQAVVGGDATIPAIMAASILAKQHRDRIMVQCGVKWPEYRFEKHKGYPTKEHRSLCRVHGLTPIHRRSFSIIQGELF